MTLPEKALKTKPTNRFELSLWPPPHFFHLPVPLLVVLAAVFGDPRQSPAQHSPHCRHPKATAATGVPLRSVGRRLLRASSSLNLLYHYLTSDATPRPGATVSPGVIRPAYKIPPCNGRPAGRPCRRACRGGWEGVARERNFYIFRVRPPRGGLTRPRAFGRMQSAGAPIV